MKLRSRLYKQKHAHFVTARRFERIIVFEREPQAMASFLGVIDLRGFDFWCNEYGISRRVRANTRQLTFTVENMMKPRLKFKPSHDGGPSETPFRHGNENLFLDLTKLGRNWHFAKCVIKNF